MFWITKSKISPKTINFNKKCSSPASFRWAQSTEMWCKRWSYKSKTKMFCKIKSKISPKTINFDKNAYIRPVSNELNQENCNISDGRIRHNPSAKLFTFWIMKNKIRVKLVRSTLIQEKFNDLSNLTEQKMSTHFDIPSVNSFLEAKNTSFITLMGRKKYLLLNTSFSNFKIKIFLSYLQLF